MKAPLPLILSYQSSLNTDYKDLNRFRWLLQSAKSTASA